MNNFESPQESPEHLFERSQIKGKEYICLVRNLTRNSSEKSDSNLLADYDSAGEAYFKKQKEYFDTHSLNALGLVSQIYKGELPQELSDPSAYELQELSPGVFLVKVEDTTYRKIKSGSRAVAVKVKEGVSFIMAPRYEDRATEEKELEENIPHEVHHLLWKGIKEAGLVQTTESNEDFQDAFLMFQDEILARMSSGGDLFGYTHLMMLDPNDRKAFEAEHPETFSQIAEVASSLNDFMREFASDLRQRNIPSSEFIGIVMEATSFEMLKGNLNAVRGHILTLPITNADKENTGWGFA